MTGFLCKQVEPYPYVFKSETAATFAETGGVLNVNNVTTTAITSMSVNVLDDSGLNRVSWIESFFTSTLTGRDLLTLSYRENRELTVVTNTAASPSVVTTSESHNYSTGDTVKITSTESPIDDKDWVITRLTATTFSIDTYNTVAGSAGTVFKFGDYTDRDVIFEITGTAASTSSNYRTVQLDWVSGTLPDGGTDVTLSFNKAGLVGSKFWYGNCTRVQEGLGLCSSTNGAWVPAVTVCKEEL